MQEVWGIFGFEAFFKGMSHILKIWTVYLLVHKSTISVSGYKLKAHVNKANIVLFDI